MGRLVPLTKKEFENKFWKKPENLLWAKNISAVPVALEEVRILCLFLPLVFVKTQEENFGLIALLNLLPEGNLLVDHQGKWVGRYIPWFFITYPFFLGFTEREEPFLLVDEDFILQEPNGLPFFKEDGTLHEEVIKIFNFLIKRHKSYQSISILCEKLADFNLIEPWELKIRFQEETKPVDGLYRINWEKYASLKDEEVLQLRKYGALLLVYAHLFSLANVELLANLAKLHALKTQPPEIPEAQRISSKETPLEDLEEILKELKFTEK